MLPLQQLIFVSNDAVVGAGHDFNPHLFVASTDGYWYGSFYFTIFPDDSLRGYSEPLDKKSSETATTSASGGFSAARSMWESKVDRGQSADATSSDKGTLWT
jgi:actin related protein 2/3 complex subunit 1A/1B